MILDDRVRDFLHDHRLTGFRRRDDQAALAFAERRHEVHQAHRKIAALGFQHQPLFRITRPQVVECNAVLRALGLVTVDLFDLQQREVAFALFGRSNLAHDRIAGTQIETLDLRGADVNVIRSVEVVPVLGAKKAVAFRQYFKDAFSAEHDVAVEEILFYAKNQVLLPQARIV